MNHMSRRKLFSFLMFHLKQKQAWNVSECEPKFYFCFLTYSNLILHGSTMAFEVPQVKCENGSEGWEVKTKAH